MSVYDYLYPTKMIHSFLNPDDAYKSAEKPLTNEWNQAQGFQQPYVQAGNNQLPQLTGAEGALLNPTQLQNQWAQSYRVSPQAQQAMQLAKSQGMDAASSMGLLGSSAALNNVQQSSNNIMNADQQQFMNDLMQKYMTGIGIGQNIYGVGAQTAGNLGTQAIQYGENMAAMEYGRQAAPGNIFGNLLQGGINAAGSL